MSKDQPCWKLIPALLGSLAICMAGTVAQAVPPPCWGGSSGTGVSSLRVLYGCTNPVHRAGSAVTFGQFGKFFTNYIDLLDNQASTVASSDSYYSGKPQNERHGTVGVRLDGLFIGGAVRDLVFDGSSPPTGEYPSTESYFASTFSVTGVSTTDPIPAILYVAGDTRGLAAAAMSVEFSVFEFGKTSQRASAIAWYSFSDDSRGSELRWSRWFAGNQESGTENPYDPSNRVDGTAVSSKIVEIPFDLPIHYDSTSGEYYGGIYISAKTRAIIVVDDGNTASIDFDNPSSVFFDGALLLVQPESGVTVSFPAGGPIFVPEPSAVFANGSVLLCLLVLRSRSARSRCA